MLVQVTRGERRWLLWPPLVFLGLMLGAPFAMLLLQSFEGGGGAYLTALTDSMFLASVLRTVVMAVVVALFCIVLGAVYGLAMWAAPRWLGAILLAWLFLSLWTAVTVRTFGWMLLEFPKGAIYWFLTTIGLEVEPISLYQTTIGMYPAMIAVMLPFAVLPVTTALSGVDREQMNAASVFGAGPALTFRTVVLPALRPALISGGVLVLIMSLSFYVTPLLLGGPRNQTVSGVINNQIGGANHPEVGAAMSVMLVIATVLIYLVSDRLFKVSERWG